MAIWFIVLVSLCICILLVKFKFLNYVHLPPGPLHLPIITDIVWLRRSLSELDPILRNLRAKHGSIFTLHFWFGPNIVIADHSLAHQALIQNGAVFANRPKIVSNKNTTGDKLNITSSSYGATWRVIRRNLSSVILHPAGFGSFSGTRKRVLDDFLNRLKTDAEKNHSVKVMEHVQDAIFSLLVFMCFGEAVDKEKIDDIKRVQHCLMSGLNRFSVLNLWPKVVTRVLFRKRWQELLHLRKVQKDMFSQLIKARKNNVPDGGVVCYVDTLLKLQIEENRELDEGEVVALCSEFLTAGTDTTSTALEWVMANLVKYPHVQERVVEEIEEVVGDREVKEEDLKKLSYLKAVILEGLRRHPPTHFVVPHAVTEDVVLNGYLIPKNGTVIFMVAEMGWDPRVWEDPMAFKPERFLSKGFEAFDITGTKEIKMMPFGAGRRICPAYNLAIFHLEYFVANLVWNFEWKAANGGNVDLSRKQKFTVVMKHPLQANIYPRFEKGNRLHKYL
ncbi:Cytochrome P450 89A9, partial [Mucuna pruriens]